MAHLIVTDGPSRGQTYALASPSVLVGRDPSCAIPIADERISRRHLQVAYDETQERHVAVDVGSSNGVFVNGERLVRGSERVLGHGDEIVIGGSTLRYASHRDPS